jgi:predicted amino acid racemase
MTTPYLSIDLDKIEHNTAAIVGLCRQQGIEVSGVTKCVCGLPEVAEAMLRGGVTSIADSRLENIRRLRAADIETRTIMLRLPALSAAEEVVTTVDISLNSELRVLEALSTAALRHDRIHEVILMVDLGDLREGIWADEVMPLVQEVIRLPGIHLRGLGTNLACFSGIAPDETNMNRLVELAGNIEQVFDLKLDWISGVNSSGLELMQAHQMPERINHARIGEAILLGRETLQRRPWPDTFQDAFTLHAEVLELKTKPSLPQGQRREDAFGRLPVFDDSGMMLRALVNLGREDVDVEGIRPLDERLSIIGASSGYLVIDASDAAGSLAVGDEIAFSINYSALLAAMTSEYVKKIPFRAGQTVDNKKR